MFCLFCGGRLPLLRDLALGEFCSPEHREHFERLEHEFQESDPVRAPARGTLARITPVMEPRAPRETPKGADNVAPIPILTVPCNTQAGSSARERLTCQPIRIIPATPEPGYVGPVTRPAPFDCQTQAFLAPSEAPVSEIS